MSLGIAVDVAKEAVEAAGTVIAQVNPAMPITLGDSFIHVRDVDFLVDKEEPLLEVGKPHLTKPIWPSGATWPAWLKTGLLSMPVWGIYPRRPCCCLKDKKDLGIHTDMLTDSLLGIDPFRSRHQSEKRNPPQEDRRLLLSGRPRAFRLSSI